MKIRHSTSSGQDKIELQMTPMIDIVFQLLIFFIMTFKIVSQEGDFNIKMPAAAPSKGLMDEDLIPPLKLKLRASEEGALAGIQLGEERQFQNFDELHTYVMGYIGKDTGPGSMQESAEVELDCDKELQYQYVVAAITAVSGYVSSDNDVVKLIEKIKFKSPPGGFN